MIARMKTLPPQIALAPDLVVPRVLTGLWQVADLERTGQTIDPAHGAAWMLPYVEAGFTAFDMADHYGSAEVIAGRFRTTHADKPICCFTKWVPKPGQIDLKMTRSAVEFALSRLGGSAIDLMQFHTWNYADPSWLDALFALQELKREGLIRHLGVTNFDTAHLRIAVASGIEIATNQISFSLIDQRAAGRMAEYCLAHGVKILAYGTLGGGWLSDRWLGAPEPDWNTLETWSQMKYGRFIRVAGGWQAFQRVLRTLSEVAKRRSVSIANVATRFMLDHPAVGAVIIGARLGKSDHIAETLKLFEFSLAAQDREEIATALAPLPAIPGDCGDEYRRPPWLTASGDLSHHVSNFPKPYAAQTDESGRSRVFSGTPWEPMAGYARAVRSGNRISVSGTTASHGSRLIGGTDAAAQAHFVIDKLEAAIVSLEGTLDDVVRTRVFVRRMEDWEAVARAHGERFGAIRPANTLVIAGLIGEEYLVEMEAEAEVGNQEDC
jgi:aryl-alcohol dehydrogenase-like predicted oxidoreductase/enamine deaminase RidA (YjgF/YER057c/UK114 family)